MHWLHSNSCCNRPPIVIHTSDPVSVGVEEQLAIFFTSEERNATFELHLPQTIGTIGVF
jgi:hypothetical protein